MKRLSVAVLTAIATIGLPNLASADTFKTKRCMNMGNALDAPREGAWGHKIEANSFKVIAKAGFDTVRIPVKWSAHTGGAPDFKIKESFFRRVTQVIDQALANDLQVILNIHHFDELNEAPEANRAKFLALWGEIAPRYKNLPESVYFEVINEPNAEFKGDLMRDIVTEGFNKIRESNPTRIIIMGGDNWSGLKSLPTIPQISDPNQIYTFHYYDPFKFTHQKTSWTELKNSGSENWGSSADKVELKAAAAYAAKVERETGIQLFLGEIGAYEKAPYRDIVDYTRETREAFEAADISWCVWNFTGTFPFYDTDKQAWDTNKLAALGLSEDRNAPKPDRIIAPDNPFAGQSLDDAFNALRRSLGREGELLMAPFSESLSVYGKAKIKVVSDDNVPGGQAAEVRVSRTAKNPWDIGISGALPGEIKRGDTVVMSYFAKTVKGDGIITNAGLQLNREPYTPLKAEPASVGNKWEQYTITAIADRDYGPSEAGYSLQIGGAKQTLRIGPVFVLNLGQ